MGAATVNRHRYVAAVLDELDETTCLERRFDADPLNTASICCRPCRYLGGDRLEVPERRVRTRDQLLILLDLTTVDRGRAAELLASSVTTRRLRWFEVSFTPAAPTRGGDCGAGQHRWRRCCSTGPGAEGVAIDDRFVASEREAAVEGVGSVRVTGGRWGA